jgi:Tfp pilus assembly protein PilZ
MFISVNQLHRQQMNSTLIKGYHIQLNGIQGCIYVLTNSVHNIGNTMLLNLAALGMPLRSPSAMLIWKRTITSKGMPDLCKKETTAEGP